MHFLPYLAWLRCIGTVSDENLYRFLFLPHLLVGTIKKKQFAYLKNGEKNMKV